MIAYWWLGPHFLRSSPPQTGHFKEELGTGPTQTLQALLTRGVKIPPMAGPWIASPTALQLPRVPTLPFCSSFPSTLAVTALGFLVEPGDGDPGAHTSGSVASRGGLAPGPALLPAV